MKPHIHGCGNQVFKAQTMLKKVVYLEPGRTDTDPDATWAFDVGLNRVMYSRVNGKYREHICSKTRKRT